MQLLLINDSFSSLNNSKLTERNQHGGAYSFRPPSAAPASLVTPSNFVNLESTNSFASVKSACVTSSSAAEAPAPALEPALGSINRAIIVARAAFRMRLCPVSVCVRFCVIGSVAFLDGATNHACLRISANSGRSTASVLLRGAGIKQTRIILLASSEITDHSCAGKEYCAEQILSSCVRGSGSPCISRFWRWLRVSGGSSQNGGYPHNRMYTMTANDHTSTRWLYDFFRIRISGAKYDAVPHWVDIINGFPSAPSTCFAKPKSVILRTAGSFSSMVGVWSNSRFSGF